jgi:hypothetical protein
MTKSAPRIAQKVRYTIFPVNSRTAAITAQIRMLKAYLISVIKYPPVSTALRTLKNRECGFNHNKSAVEFQAKIMRACRMAGLIRLLPADFSGDFRSTTE